MALMSKLFKGDRVFERCLTDDAGHITPGSKGFHVAKIQDALMKLVGAFPAKIERDRAFYGPTTAKAVLAYKTKRKIINLPFMGYSLSIRPTRQVTLRLNSSEKKLVMRRLVISLNGRWP